MKVLSMNKFNSDIISVFPMSISSEKMLLCANIRLFIKPYGYYDVYFEYDFESDLSVPFPIFQDPYNGVIRIIKAGISDNYIYHAVIEKSDKESDIIGIYMLLQKERSNKKIFEFKLYKSENYMDFNDFSNAFIWIGELEKNKLLIRVTNNSGKDCTKYYYKDLDKSLILELDSNVTSMDMRYYGKVKDNSGEYYVFRTGNFGSIEDRRWAVSCGYENEYVEDKIIAVTKTDFELYGLNNEVDHIIIEFANKNQGIDTVWIEKNCIHYFKESILDDKSEHLIFDFGKKTKITKQGKLANLFPTVNNGRSFYHTENDGSINIYNDEEEQVFLLKTSNHNEHIEEINSNYVRVGSYDKLSMKKIYEMQTSKYIGEYEANSFKYFDKDDVLVIF